MADFCENRIEDDAAVGIVLDAEDFQTARRCGILPCLDRARSIVPGDGQHRGEAKSRAAAGRAGDGQIAAHAFRQQFDDGKTEAGAAIAAGDFRIGLCERMKQPCDLGARQTDAAVGDGEIQAHPAPCRAPRLRFEANETVRGEFHGVVDQVFQRRPQPHRVAEHDIGQIVRDRDFGAQPFGLRPRRERLAQTFDQAARPKRRLLQNERPGIGLGGVDDERGQRGEMLGAGLDAGSPAPLPLADIRARQQFAQRENAGQCGANVMREDRQYGFVGAGFVCCGPRGARRRCGATGPSPHRLFDRLFLPFLFGLHSCHR